MACDDPNHVFEGERDEKPMDRRDCKNERLSRFDWVMASGLGNVLPLQSTGEVGLETGRGSLDGRRRTEQYEAQ